MSDTLETSPDQKDLQRAIGRNFDHWMIARGLTEHKVEELLGDLWKDTAIKRLLPAEILDQKPPSRSWLHRLRHGSLTRTRQGRMTAQHDLRYWLLAIAMATPKGERVPSEPAALESAVRQFLGRVIEAQTFGEADSGAARTNLAPAAKLSADGEALRAALTKAVPSPGRQDPAAGSPSDAPVLDRHDKLLVRKLIRVAVQAADSRDRSDVLTSKVLTREAGGIALPPTRALQDVGFGGSSGSWAYDGPDDVGAEGRAQAIPEVLDALSDSCLMDEIDAGTPELRQRTSDNLLALAALYEEVSSGMPARIHFSEPREAQRQVHASVTTEVEQVVRATLAVAP